MFPALRESPRFLQAAPYLTPYLQQERVMWLFGAQSDTNIVLYHQHSLILHPDLVLLGSVASSSSSLSNRFPKCYISFLLIFTLVIPLGLPSEFPRKRKDYGHGVSEVAVNFGKLMILCKKKFDLSFYSAIWVLFFCF